MQIEEYFGDWLKVIDIQGLYKVVEAIRPLYESSGCEPSYNDIFKAFHVTPYKDTCIISIGQDPYPQKGVSTGVAFANKKDVKKLSPSLELIKEAVINFEVPHNLTIFDATLEEWSRQGILLLNSALTVKQGSPGSHLHIWRPFIISLLKKLGELNPGLIYVLWGNTAKSFIPYIGKNETVFKFPHPAYYARTGTKIPSNFFTQIDNEVYKRYGTRIKWYKELNLNL